jgi:hypothetical protein
VRVVAAWDAPAGAGVSAGTFTLPDPMAGAERPGMRSFLSGPIQTLLNPLFSRRNAYRGFFLRTLFLCLIFCCLPQRLWAQTALVLDGEVQAAEWREAIKINDFARTQPFNLTAAPLNTEVWMRATAAGLALAFVCAQPKKIAFNAPARARDAIPNSDAVTAIIDFDGTGNRAYEFTVAAGGSQRDGIWSGENTFSADWDGVWKSAVARSEDGWSVEMLIPWSTVPMRKSLSAQRAIRASFDRAIWNAGERYSYPPISPTQSRYLSDFASYSITSFAQQALSVVPYASVQYDLVDAKSSARTGADVSWRVGDDFTLTAAITPDFGQVESDQLVVNFDAIEVAFSDKRAFFTENQALFDVRDRNSNQLIYTRRVGAERDLDGAVKLTGSTHGLDYGAFVAIESDVGGSDFYAARALLPGQILSAGYLITDVRKSDGENASVQGLDFKLRPNAAHTFDALFIGSNRQDCLSCLGKSDYTDFGGTAGWSYASKAWDFGGFLTHYGRDLDFNDFGYQARSDFNSVDFYGTWRPQAERADGASMSYNMSLDLNANDSGVRLPDQIFAYRQLNQGNGGFQSTQLLWLSAGYDDLISRGNGLMWRPQRFRFSHFYQSPQRGRWRYTASLQNLQEGLGGRAWNIITSANYQASSSLTLDGNLRWRNSPDWLVWRGGDLFARYQRTQFITNFNINWIPTPKHELRFKLQSLIINANAARAVRLSANAMPFASNDVIAPLQVRNFGAQLRYKYQFAPQRELYIVYARGGIAQEREDLRSSFALFQDSFDLRDSEQFLIKLRWGL